MLRMVHTYSVAVKLSITCRLGKSLYTRMYKPRYNLLSTLPVGLMCCFDGVNFTDIGCCCLPVLLYSSKENT